MTDILIRRGKFEHRHTQRQRLELCCYKPRNTKDHQQSPETRKGKEGFFPRALGGSMAVLAH